MMDEKQIESLKRRYGSRIADAPKRRRGPERMAVMKGGSQGGRSDDATPAFILKTRPDGDDSLPFSV